MNKDYAVEFGFDTHFAIPVKITAESGEQALNQAQGMLHGEWTNIVDIEGYSTRVRPERIVFIKVVEELNI